MHAAGRVVGKLAYLALIGFVAILLSGPIIAVISALFSLAVALLSVLVPFALIGVLIWLPWRLCVKGRAAALEDVTRAGRKVCAVPLFLGKRSAGPVLRVGWQSCKRASSLGLHAGCIMRRKVGAVRSSLRNRSIAPAVQIDSHSCHRAYGFGMVSREILVETFCGGLLGAIVAAVGTGKFNLPRPALYVGPEHPEILVGLAVGALIGFVVALSRREARHVNISCQPAAECPGLES